MDRDAAYRLYRRVVGGLKNQPRVDRNGLRIEMRMTFDEWYQIWLDSGKLHLRGSGRGKYCMARHNDVGHYEVGNVSIIPFCDNISEGHLGKPKSEDAKKKMSIAKRNGPKGKDHPLYGKKKSAEHCANLSKAHKDKPLSPGTLAAVFRDARKIVTCPHCGLTSNGPTMRRYHFTNCKHSR